jgi:hypothetical protein
MLSALELAEDCVLGRLGTSQKDEVQQIGPEQCQCGSSIERDEGKTNQEHRQLAESFGGGSFWQAGRKGGRDP